MGLRGGNEIWVKKINNITLGKEGESEGGERSKDVHCVRKKEEEKRRWSGMVSCELRSEGDKWSGIKREEKNQEEMGV